MNKKEIVFNLETLFRVVGEKEMIIIQQNQLIQELETENLKLKEYIKVKTEEVG